MFGNCSRKITLPISEAVGANEPLTAKKQPLNQVVDIIAKSRPYGVGDGMPISATTYKSGFRRIHYQQFANAVNGMAWWLHDTLCPGYHFETLAFWSLGRTICCFTLRSRKGWIQGPSSIDLILDRTIIRMLTTCEDAFPLTSI